MGDTEVVESVGPAIELYYCMTYVPPLAKIAIEHIVYHILNCIFEICCFTALLLFDIVLLFDYLALRVKYSCAGVDWRVENLPRQSTTQMLVHRNGYSARDIIRLNILG